jgi:hypothetical protein
MAYTPGPWFTEDAQPGDLFRYVMCGEGDTLAHLCRTSINGNQNAEADARLIAAAPELLAALKVALRDLEMISDTGDWGTELDPAIFQAREAIAKAIGTAP